MSFSIFFVFLFLFAGRRCFISVLFVASKKDVFSCWGRATMEFFEVLVRFWLLQDICWHVEAFYICNTIAGTDCIVTSVRSPTWDTIFLTNHGNIIIIIMAWSTSLFLASSPPRRNQLCQLKELELNNLSIKQRSVYGHAMKIFLDNHSIVTK